MITSLTVRLVIIYIRISLSVQAVFITFIAWAILLTIPPGESRGPNIVAALAVSVLAAIGVAAAALMNRRRRSAAVAAFAIETVWAATSFWSAALPSGPPDGEYYLTGVLSLIALVGLLLTPVRSYLFLTRISRFTGKLG